MAECVSCGKKIPAGKLFCDECYVRMKGRMGPRKKPELPQEAGAVSGPHYRSAAGTGPGGERVAGTITVLGEGRGRVGTGARADLTPPSQKKVVSMRPKEDAAAKEKGRSGKKFTITITFSEKTYERVARIKGRLKRKPGEEKVSVSAVASPAAAAPRPRVKRKKGPYGMPLLRAVDGGGGTTGRGAAGVLRHRGRPWDKGDYLTLAASTSAAAMILALSFLEWVKLNWVSQQGAVLQAAGVKGTDLGLTVYLAMALAALAWLFMAASLLLGGDRVWLDFGVPLLVAGLIVISLVFVALSDTASIYDKAVRAMLKRGASVPVEAGGYERHTVWTSYLMILAGLVMSFSGLIRLSERREKRAVEVNAGGGG